jgi:hypothetical protein
MANAGMLGGVRQSERPFAFDRLDVPARITTTLVNEHLFRAEDVRAGGPSSHR